MWICLWCSRGYNSSVLFHRRRLVKDFHIDLCKMGHILLVRHEKGWIGDIIVKAQIKAKLPLEIVKFTHSATLGGGQYVVDPIVPRIKIIDIRKRYAGRYVKIVKYDNDTYDKKRYKVAFWAATHNNLAYDFLGVLKFKLSFLFHRKRAYFCSECVLESLQREYPQALGGMKPHKAMPAHFLLGEFKIVWEGYIPK